MRRVVIDIETTGTSLAEGHRVVELACVEIIDRQMTGRHFHRYLNPERAVDPAAWRVHGIGTEFLADKPKFESTADDLVEFIRNAVLVAHNAPFDVGFLDNELRLSGRETVDSICAGVLDTMALARDTHPGEQANLSALCGRYRIDTSGWASHPGALLDSRCLAEVYLRMTANMKSLKHVPAGEQT